MFRIVAFLSGTEFESAARSPETGQRGCSQMIIHGVPNRSTSMPNRCAKKVCPIGLPRTVDPEGHGETFHRPVGAIGWRVGTHQHLVADDEASVHDLAAPFRR